MQNTENRLIISFIKNNIFSRLVKFISSNLKPWIDAPFIQDNENISTFTHPLPQNFNQLPFEFAQQYNDQVTIIQPRKIYYLKNVYATWHGLVFKNLNIFIPSLQAPDLINYFQEPLLLKQWFPKVTDIPDKFGVAIAHNQFAQDNYFHWIIDSLPRLINLREHHPNIPIVVLDSPKQFVIQTAEALGFNQFIKVNRKQVLKIHKLVLPDEGAVPVGCIDPYSIKIVREELIKKLGIANINPHRRIFVSRAKQTFRKIANQNELDLILKIYNFETVFFEGLPISEQIKIMQEATIFLSVHGANMANLLFLNAGTPVIELQSNTLINPLYWRLSTALSLPYYVLPCTPVINEPLNNHSDVDIVVDTKKLEKILKILV